MAFVKAWQAMAFAGVVLVVASELVGGAENPGVFADAAGQDRAAETDENPAVQSGQIVSTGQNAPAPAEEAFDFAAWVEEGERDSAADDEESDAEEEARPASTTRRTARSSAPTLAAANVPVSGQPRRNLSPEERARLVQPPRQSPEDSEQRLLRDLTAALD